MVTEEIDVLHARIAELELRLRRVTAERDELRRRVEGDEPAALAPLDKDSCRACDGEGVLWVHDFRMDCRRCRGTGRVLHDTT